MKKFELNPVARKWVKALRSGKYKQVTGVLTEMDKERKVIGHCCLGVLCELAVADGIVKKTVTKTGRVRYGGKDALLPKQVQKWAQLKTDNGHFGRPYPADYSSLVRLNDDKDSFKAIARVIEQKAKELFFE